MNKNVSVSILITAYNEEHSVEKTVINAVEVMENMPELDYEVIIWDDGSTDKTGEIAEKLKDNYDNVKVFHNEKNMGQGYSIKRGIKEAEKEWFVLIPGDFQFVFEDIKEYIPKCNDNDFIIGYILNLQRRTIIRRILSNSFKITERILFGMKFKYTGGMNLYRTKLLQSIPLKATGHTILSEIAVRLLKQGYSYTTVGFHLRERESGRSHAVRLRSILNALFSTINLWLELQFKREK